jgi:hypothetical protein
VTSLKNLITSKRALGFFRVDPITGACTILSDFGVGANQGASPNDVTVYPVISAPVGWVVTPVNKLEVLAPYLVLAGLIVVVSSEILKKRKQTQTNDLESLRKFENSRNQRPQYLQCYIMFSIQYEGYWKNKYQQY